MMSRAQALAEGFTIDDAAMGRPVAYKGPRSNPTEWHDLLTDLETAMLVVIKEGVNLYRNYDLLANGKGCGRWVSHCTDVIYIATGRR